MASPHRVYRALIHLYPPDFRRRYGQDLVQHFDDLISDRGVGAAWARTGLDLTVTVPRYQLEHIMNQHQSTTALHATVGLLTLGGVATLTIGNQIGIVLLIAGLALGLTQRSALATSLRVPDTSLRRKRLRTAAVLGGIFALSYATFVFTVGDSWTISDTLLALIGTPAMIAAPLFLLAGLLTPRTPASRDLADPIPGG
jgi:peptidoglycan/LPS O-acetylase OafA/YrhL